MSRLRSPNGCPWDREQTYATLAPMLLEEAYEAFDAVEEARSGKPLELRDELGVFLRLRRILVLELRDEQLEERILPQALHARCGGAPCRLRSSRACGTARCVDVHVGSPGFARSSANRIVPSSS